jgi:hypothetical protein
VGTIYPGEGGPHIHYHASVGRAGHALTGCLREKAVTYLIVEAVIYEFTGLSARKEFDEKTQIHLPVLGNRNDDTGTTESEPIKEDQQPVTREEKKEDKSELPGGLAEIIRDLTRRPPT